MRERIKVGRYSKMMGDYIVEDTADWRQEFKCPRCGAKAIYWPLVKKWNPEVCGCRNGGSR